jgi:hypothetical protein
MSISGISASTDPYQAYQANGQNNLKQFRQDFQDLASALQSGDLAGAQKAFAGLQQLMPNPSAGNQTSTDQQGNGQNPFAADFSAFGKALQSASPNNLSDAQAAFAKLQQDMQSVKGHHHHHHHPKTSVDTQSITPTTAGVTDGTSSGSFNITV